eukprot:1503913-Amphidinium_carterae.1
MAYVDDLLVVGDTMASQQFLQQFQLKHTTQLARSTSLEFLGKTIEQQDDGNKKPPIAGQPVDKEQHSMYRTAIRQLLWVSQLRVDIAYAVKELSHSLQQPDNEDLKNLKQLL